MLKTIPLQANHISLLATITHRSQLPYQEYSFLSDDKLKDFFKNRLFDTLQDSSAHALIVVSDTGISGFINCEYNQFDSEIFEFGCYRITDFLIFSDDPQEISSVSTMLISSLEDLLASISLPYHLGISLNNNIINVDKLFNSLTSNKFYYLHTLLTFCSRKNRFESHSYYPNEKVTIRTAKIDDAEQVSLLAKKSFKFSRFHIDPFLDDLKAGILLKTSAENSILHGYVDVMFVAEIDKKIVGYYSGKKSFAPEFNETIGKAVISAVDVSKRGLGIFSKLDAHLLNWFADLTGFSEMGTYLVNIPVHKTWVKKGLGIIRGSHQFSKFHK